MALNRDTMGTNYFDSHKTEHKVLCNEIKADVQRLVTDILLLEGTEESCAQEIAQQVLDGATVGLNAIKETPDYIKKINRIGKHFSSLKDRSFLLVSLPIANHNFEPPLDVFQEADARHLQFDHFLSAFESCRTEPEKNEVHRKSALDYNTVLHECKEFIQTRARYAKEAFIILNGHGSKDGMSLKWEQENIPWDKVIKDLEDLISERPSNIVCFPKKFHLIFAQCFAHCRNIKHSTQDDINIISFTSPGRETTSMTISREEGTYRIIDSKHIELNQFAKSATARGELVRSGRLPPMKHKRLVGIRLPVHNAFEKNLHSGPRFSTAGLKLGGSKSATCGRKTKTVKSAPPISEDKKKRKRKVATEKYKENIGIGRDIGSKPCASQHTARGSCRKLEPLPIAQASRAKRSSNDPLALSNRSITKLCQWKE